MSPINAPLCASDQQLFVLVVEALLERVRRVYFGAFGATGLRLAAGPVRGASAEAALGALLARQHAEQLPLALGRSKVVDQRVQEAVETSHTQKHQIRRIGTVRGLLGLTDPRVELQEVHQEQAVCGCEAHHKHHQHRQSHHHRSGSSAGAARHPARDAGQRPDHLGVGHRGDEQRQEEERAAEGDEVELAVPNLLLHRQDVMAGGDAQLLEVNGLLREDEGHRAGEGQNPHGRAGYDGVPRPPPDQGIDGVGDGEEAVHADASDEEDGAVHVPVKGGGDHAAHHRAEQPVVAAKVVDDLEGQEHGEDQVGGGQVEHVDGGGLLGADPPAEGHQGADVDGHADEADHRVEGRDEDGGHGAREEEQGLLRDPRPHRGIVARPRRAAVVVDVAVVIRRNRERLKGGRVGKDGKTPAACATWRDGEEASGQLDALVNHMWFPTLTVELRRS